MPALEALTVEADDPDAARAFYEAVGLSQVRVRDADAPSSGFRGFTLSLVSPQPSAVDGLLAAAAGVGAAVLQLGVKDVAASRAFYVERGFGVARSFGRRYVELDTGGITVSLNARRAVAKAAGVSPEGSGSHRLAIHSDAGAFTDPDGFVWEP